MTTETDLRERLAAIQHDIWSHWHQYVLSRATTDKHGNLVIPKELAYRWSRQSVTAYADLSEDEQVSDRTQVDRYWPLIAPLAEATSADPQDRSTPFQIADYAHVRDRKGNLWCYNEAADVWNLRDEPTPTAPIVLSSARSWQRLLAEFGPLTTEPCGYRLSVRPGGTA